MLDVDVISAVIENIVQAVQEETPVGLGAKELGDGIQVYNVLRDVRPFEYNRTVREWLPVQTPPQLFPGPDQKAKICQDRYQVLWQRLLMEERFVAASEAGDTMLLPHQEVITPVESMLGNPGRKTTL